MSPDARFEVAPDVHARKFDSEVVILDLVRGNYYGLDEVGAAYWQRMVEGKSLMEAAADLSDLYEVSEATLVADLTRLVEELLRQGLVRPRTS